MTGKEETGRQEVKMQEILVLVWMMKTISGNWPDA